MCVLLFSERLRPPATNSPRRWEISASGRRHRSFYVFLSLAPAGVEKVAERGARRLEHGKYWFRLEGGASKRAGQCAAWTWSTPSLELRHMREADWGRDGLRALVDPAERRRSTVKPKAQTESGRPLGLRAQAYPASCSRQRSVNGQSANRRVHAFRVIFRCPEQR